MPILVKCGGCQSKMNAPDAAAGKKVKCPKCGGVVPVPGGAAAPAPAQAAAKATPKPAAQASAPAATKPRPKPASAPAPSQQDPALELLSFDDLKVTGKYRAKIEDEIGDEEIVWAGRQSAAERLRQAKLGPIFGIVLLALAPAALLLNNIEVTPDNQWIMKACAIGLAVILLLFALPLLFMPLLVKKFINYRPVYVLTDRRTIVFTYLVVKVKVQSYTPEELLKDMKVKEGEGGVGDIVMGTEEYHHQGHLKHTHEVKKSESGKKKFVKDKLEMVGAHTSHIPVGFMDVEDVQDVAAQIRYTLKLPPP